MIKFALKIVAISFLYAMHGYSLEQSVLYNIEDLSGQNIFEIGQKFSKLSQASSQVWIIASTLAMSEIIEKDVNFSDEENGYINQVALIRVTTNNMIKSSSRYKILWLCNNFDTKLNEEIDKKIAEPNDEQYNFISPDSVITTLSLSSDALKNVIMISSKE